MVAHLRKPLTLYINWHNPELTRLEAHNAGCIYCDNPYTLSYRHPFTNTCPDCLHELVGELVTLLDTLFTERDPSWPSYKPPLDAGICPHCHHYDPSRDPEMTDPVA